MAGTTGQKQRAIAQLNNLADSAEFTQLVRLAKRMAKKYQLSLSYQVSPALNFPVNDIAAIVHEKNNDDEKLTIMVRFLGLIGVSGILPEHYSEYLLQRLQAKDPSLLAFLDVFHHQLLSLFYQSKQLGHFYLAEEEQQQHVIPDLLTAVSGQAMVAGQDWQWFYAGLLGNQSRSLQGLTQILQHYFQLPITISAYTPTWQRLNQDGLTRLTRMNHHLGRGAILGKRFTSVDERFTINICVDSYTVFQQCLPGSQLLKQLNTMVKLYYGLQYEHDITVSIAQKRLPKTLLSKKRSSLLGWNTTLSANSYLEKQRVVSISAQQCQKAVA